MALKFDIIHLKKFGGIYWPKLEYNNENNSPNIQWDKNYPASSQKLCQIIGWLYFRWWHINVRGLFNAKATLVEEWQWDYLTDTWGDKGAGTFLKSICSKMNLIARLGFELIYLYGGARGVVVIVVGHGHGDTSSNPGRDWLHFT